MKIGISEYEQYEVNLPEVITREQFISLMERLNRILKLVSTDVFSSDSVVVSQNGNVAKRHYERHKRTKIDRELAIKLLKVHYGEGTTQEKLANLKALAPHVSESSFKSRLYQLKNVFKIEPSEIGLVRYPTRFDGAAKNLDKFRIQNGKQK